MNTENCACTPSCDPKNCSCRTCHDSSRCGMKAGFKCISWTGIVVGALIAVGLGFLLNLYSISIGLSILKADSSGVLTYAMGGFIGLLIGTVISLFIAGWVAGVLNSGYCSRHNLGLMYGFVTWSLALVISILLASQVTQFVASYSNFLAYPAIELSQTTGKSVTPQEMKSPQVAANVQKLSDNVTMTKSAFATFLLFFVGALSSCMGGYAGVVSARRCCKEDYTKKE